MMKKFVFGSCLVFSLFYGDCWGMNNGHNTEDSDSDSSSHSSAARAVFLLSQLIPEYYEEERNNTLR